MTKEQWMWMRASVALMAAAAAKNEGRSEALEQEVLHLGGIRPHGPAVPQFVRPPWPAEIDWREIVRKNAI